MSIPPLVCSTPPPPDQCDDDKDPEDFDIQYNLSQEEEDDNYNYGSFAYFNHFEASPHKVNSETDKVVIPEQIDESSKQVKRPHDIGNNFEIKSCDEEINVEDTIVEDLDLRLDPNTIKAGGTCSKEDDKIGDKQEVESFTEVASSFHVAPILEAENNLEIHSDFPNNLQPENLHFEIQTEGASCVDEINAVVYTKQSTPPEREVPLDLPEDIEDNFKEAISISITKNKTDVLLPELEQVKAVTLDKLKSNQTDDDDFGDFDDFQYAAPLEKPVTLDICDNPWDNSVHADDDFGDFKANFEEGSSSLFSQAVEDMKCSPNIQSGEETSNESERVVPCIETSAPEEDEFGDFNDFQTSNENKPDFEANEHELQNFNLLNMDASEEEFTASVNNIIKSVFEHEIQEPKEECNGKLESVLGETWGYLLAVDEREPYIVNWNNSSAQKTLLKALCIDSRNILFGPKWNYNMPKYAANLSVAPLQPQKQLTSPITQTEPSNQEKPSKSSGTWNDPFTSEGQESTYAEALLLDLEHLMATLDQMANSHSSVKISELLTHACNPESSSKNSLTETGPSTREVFEVSSSCNPEKIFSSTLNVQPIRQISLPDTHIFTPTDSETPRSTTIHYDNSPTVLLPQTVIEMSKSDPGFQNDPRPSSPKPGPSNADDDYWEFQDFRSSTSSKRPSAPSIAPTASDPPKENTSVTYGTQVLQPVKVEPIIPTLNWPDPGEVKETFDDFSDFISSSTNLGSQTQSEHKETNISTSPDIQLSNTMKPASTSSDLADDFNTFQSALPSANSLDFGLPGKSGNVATSGSKTVVTTPERNQQTSDFNFAFPKVENVKSEPISIEKMCKPVLNQTNLIQNKLEVKSTVMPSSSGPTSLGILQPIPAASTSLQGQQKSGQILQPLSLESFSQINWPNPGIDLQDLSRFNPVETLHSLKSDLSVNSQSKVASPVHNQKVSASSQLADDDWGDFVSSAPKPTPHPQQQIPKTASTFADDDEWTDFVSSPSVKPQNGLNTISFNVHTNTNLTMQKTNPGKRKKNSQLPLEIPSLNYIDPKSTNLKYSDRHLNL